MPRTRDSTAWSGVRRLSGSLSELWGNHGRRPHCDGTPPPRFAVWALSDASDSCGSYARDREARDPQGIAGHDAFRLQVSLHRAEARRSTALFPQPVRQRWGQLSQMARVQCGWNAHAGLPDCVGAPEASMSFSALIDKLSSLVSKSYVFAAFIPVLVFAFVNWALLWFHSRWFHRWASDELSHPSGFVLTCLALG